MDVGEQAKKENVSIANIIEKSALSYLLIQPN